MKKWATRNCTICQILKGRSNSFLINSKNNYILVDTGRENSWKELETKLDKYLGANKLSCLILTHTHFDHAENALKIKEKYTAKIVVHKSESGNLKRGDNTPLQGTYPVTRFMVNLLGKHLLSRNNYEPAEPDILVDQKYDLNNFGFNGCIIHTPGHSRGSISIIIDNEIAITGDTLYGVFPNSAYPPFASDPEMMVQSWKKLLKTDCKLFLPGHGKGIKRELLEKEYKKREVISYNFL